MKGIDKMKVGDFVRTKNKQFQPSQIAKIKKIEKDMVYKGQKCLNLDHNLLSNYEFLIYEEDVIKSSPKIIDLIEVGDIVTTNNLCGEITKIDGNKIYTTCYDGEYCSASDIKSIVTKEQFEAMEYKVGE